MIEGVCEGEEGVCVGALGGEEEGERVPGENQAPHQKEGEEEEQEEGGEGEEEEQWVRMSGNILELEQLRDSRELSASQLHLLLHPTQASFPTKTKSKNCNNNFALKRIDLGGGGRAAEEERPDTLPQHWRQASLGHEQVRLTGALINYSRKRPVIESCFNFSFRERAI